MKKKLRKYDNIIDKYDKHVINNIPLFNIKSDKKYIYNKKYLT